MLFHDIPIGESSDPVGRQQSLSETPAHWSLMGRPPSTSTHRRLRPRVQLEATPALVGHAGSQSAGIVFGTHATTMSWASRTDCDNAHGIRETPRSPTCVIVNSDDDFQDDPPVRLVRPVRDRVVIRGRNCGSSSAAQSRGTTRLASGMDADDDDDFVDLTGLHNPWRYRDPERLRVEEERDMLRLDEEWIWVTIAYDVLRSIGDIYQVDESELYAQTYGNAGRNGASRFWSMLQSTRKIISNLEEISAWDVFLRRRQLRRGL
jgi:hypothetical protein